MARLALFCSVVGICVLLGGCTGKETKDQLPARASLSTVQSPSLPGSQKGNHVSTPQTARAIHHQGAIYRREHAPSGNMSE